MELFRIIKSDARKALRFCGGRTVAAMLIVFLAYLAISLMESVLLLVFMGTEAIHLDYFASGNPPIEVLCITGGCSVLYFIVLSVIAMGYTKLHFSFAEGKDESISTLFDMFSSGRKFFGTLLFEIFYGIRTILSGAFAAAPGTALFYIAYNYLPETGRTLQLIKISACCIAISLIILCLSLWLIFIQRWHLARYYFINKSGIFKSFSLSVKATKGLRVSLLKFKFSFMGWALLSVLILPLIWAIPYYAVSEAIYSKYLMERYSHSLAQVPGDEFFDEETTEEEG
ncbi:MAG: DUF975 family protein [Oscillospiraceae bacterium]|nr:DUF975 family protein [Oscillospiraceae bacterium]